MMAALSLESVAQFAALRLGDALLEGMLIAAFAALLLWFLRRRNSGTRFAVAFVALLAVALAPFVHVLRPATANAPGSHATPTSIFVLPGSVALDVFLAWALLAFIGLVRVGVSLWQLRIRRRSFVELDGSKLNSLLPDGLAQFCPRRRVAICQSDRVHAPTAVGLVRPAVVLPAWLLDELSPAELEQVLLHELAHLRRWDDWTNLAQKLVKALLFFHPAVWWVESKISLEREMACDDAVLAETANPRAYAQCLTRLAERSFLHRGVMLAQAAVSRVRQTTLRVLRILKVDRPGSDYARKPAAWLIAIFAGGCLVLSSFTPHLVTFHDTSTRASVQPSSLHASRTAVNAAEVPAALLGDNNSALHNPRTPNSRRHHHASLEAVPSVAFFDYGEGPMNVVPATDILCAYPCRATVVVFIEGDTSGPSTRQIHTWRITIYQAVTDPTKGVSKKI